MISRKYEKLLVLALETQILFEEHHDPYYSDKLEGIEDCLKILKLDKLWDNIFKNLLAYYEHNRIKGEYLFDTIARLKNENKFSEKLFVKLLLEG